MVTYLHNVKCTFLQPASNLSYEDNNITFYASRISIIHVLKLRIFLEKINHSVYDFRFKELIFFLFHPQIMLMIYTITGGQKISVTFVFISVETRAGIWVLQLRGNNCLHKYGNLPITVYNIYWRRRLN